jgi:hypothetical protein
MAKLELDLQKKTRDAVIKDGGACQIISHRFVIGVPDMLVKPRAAARSILAEAKQREAPLKAESFDLDVTPRQMVVLLAFAKAGMPAAVISYLRTPHSKEVCVGIFSPLHLGWTPSGRKTVRVGEHFPIDRAHVAVVHSLVNFEENWT